MQKFFLTAALIFALSWSSCSAEDLRFIDAMDDTGYYYDADSVNHDENSAVIYVKMAVIKAGLNQMYTYDIRIHYNDHSYEILSTKKLSYDTRAEIESNNTRRPLQRYSDKSEMAQMVRLILYGD
ncbi:MAG: hypothetical protein IJ774_01105 [Selenomonadaceae bacterium]|nr:hypothetical protein [Selenomonadaceae bacterium]